MAPSPQWSCNGLVKGRNWQRLAALIAVAFLLTAASSQQLSSVRLNKTFTAQTANFASVIPATSGFVPRTNTGHGFSRAEQADPQELSSRVSAGGNSEDPRAANRGWGQNRLSGNAISTSIWTVSRLGYERRLFVPEKACSTSLPDIRPETTFTDRHWYAQLIAKSDFDSKKAAFGTRYLVQPYSQRFWVSNLANWRHPSLGLILKGWATRPIFLQVR